MLEQNECLRLRSRNTETLSESARFLLASHPLRSAGYYARGFQYAHERAPVVCRTMGATRIDDGKHHSDSYQRD